MFRRLQIALIDLVSVLGVCVFLIWFYPSEGTHITTPDKLINIAVIVLCVFACRVVGKVYKRVWRYAATQDYVSIVLSDIAAGFLFYLLNTYVLPGEMTFLRCLSVFTAVSLATVTSRLIYRVYIDNSRVREYSGTTEYINRIKIAIVGAGNVGTMLAKELIRNPQAHYVPYCFIDTDPQKVNTVISGIKVIKEPEDVVATFKQMPVQEIVIALPKLTSDDKQAVYRKYAATGCKIKLYDYPLDIGGAETEGNTRTLREFKIEDLLFREAISFNVKALQSIYSDKVILVTGGGGSIGSELSRQIARFKPKKLILFDIYENTTYDLQQELLRKYGSGIDLAVEIGSVRDKKRLEELFDMYKPQVVFHAAAHKHVPLMEHNCNEAIKNNVFGTLNMVEVSEAFGVERFLLISTDKAVNPTNVMGASKRLCEMIVQSHKHSKTKFLAVRFGNVLGSNGSVIPLFTRQIQSGGPITLTDKRIIRYFMTIPEAAQLVLEACAMANAGEIYVLDMGKPIKIIEMAENMIRLCGLTPYVDIDITEVGLRPGEKLYEELLIKTEELDKTDNALIFIERDTPPTLEEMAHKLSILSESLKSGIAADVVDAVRRTVPTYQSPETVNALADKTDEMRSAAEVSA